MVRFGSLEMRGARLAVMSDLSDGDCRLYGGEGARARREFYRNCGLIPGRVASGAQVHGVRIARVRAAHGAHGSTPPFAETDGLITNEAALPLAISVADCVPLFLLDVRQRAIGLVHAGRAGTENRIATAAIVAMRDAYDSRPVDMYAVIGPSAGPEAYEVSAEIAAEFAGKGFPVRGRNIDLWEANAQQLEACGIPRTQIEISGICTITSGRFHSHRAHANGARNVAVLML